MSLRTIFLGLVLALSASSVRSTDCGDVPSDNTVPNCCGAENGECIESCEIFYYKTEDMQCARCPGAPKCAQCDPDDPDTCVLYKQNVPNCADINDWGVCIECEDNYTLFTTNGNQKCVKCKASNCYQCTSDGKKCKKCQWGYGANKKGCSKCPSKCGECDSKGRCTRCYAGYAIKSGKCKKCSKFGNTSCGFDGTTCKC